jgi:integrase
MSDLEGGQREAYEAVLRHSLRDEWPCWWRARLARIIRETGVQSPRDLAAWDCADLKRAVQPYAHRGLANALRNAKLAPELDVAGAYASHLQFVPRALMERHPALWQLPARFAIRIAKVSDPDEAALLVEIAKRTVDMAVMQFHRRLPVRVKESKVIQLCSVLGAIAREAQPASLRTTLGDIRGPDDALAVIARAVAHTQRSRVQHTRLPPDMAYPRAAKMLLDFQMLVRYGVFESQGVPCETVFTKRALERRMQELERADPARYAAVERHIQSKTEVKLTPEDVARLYGVCRTRKETAVLAMLAESAFRAGAISRARLADVWDDPRAEVRPVVALMEKGSKVRRNVPNARLRTALRDYIVNERRPVGEWLFPHQHQPRRMAAKTAEHVARRLCTRAGLRGVSAHSFRRYVVNTAMRAGNKLETVQKWLGHASGSTTMRHYWTDDLSELDITAPVLNRSEDVAQQLEEALAEIARLRGNAIPRSPTTVVSACSTAAWWDAPAC